MLGSCGHSAQFSIQDGDAAVVGRVRSYNNSFPILPVTNPLETRLSLSADRTELVASASMGMGVHVGVSICELETDKAT